MSNRGQDAEIYRLAAKLALERRTGNMFLVNNCLWPEFYSMFPESFGKDHQSRALAMCFMAAMVE